MKRLKFPLVVGIVLSPLAVLMMSTGIANAASWTIVTDANKANSNANVLNVLASPYTEKICCKVDPLLKERVGSLR